MAEVALAIARAIATGVEKHHRVTVRGTCAVSGDTGSPKYEPRAPPGTRPAARRCGRAPSCLESMRSSPGHTDASPSGPRAPRPGRSARRWPTRLEAASCCCCSTQRAQPPDPQAREPLSLWMEAWPTHNLLLHRPLHAAAVQHNARARMVPGPPSTGVAIAMDGGMELGKDMKRTRPANSYLFTMN